MSISTQDFTTLVRNQVAAIQGSASQFIDLTVGSILRAIVESNAALVLWLQSLILQLLATTRASTSTGTDLDSWVADYGLTRLVAISATGNVTFSRFNNTLQAVIPVGATVQSADGSQIYSVILDTSNVNYSASLGGYVLASGTTSIALKVLANVAGAAGNAAIGQINTLTTAIAGVDTVSNAAAFTTGVNAESDSALRARFVAYVASLSKATKAAIGYTITSLQQGMSYLIIENTLYNGTTQVGFFTVIIDDGTGYPSGTLISTVSNAIDLVRPVGSSFAVYAPVVVTATASMAITTDTGYIHSTLVGAVGTAITSYINSLPLGAVLRYSRLAQIAYDVSPGVINVFSVTLNGATADITPTSLQIIKSGTTVVS